MEVYGVRSRKSPEHNVTDNKGGHIPRTPSCECQMYTSLPLLNSLISGTAVKWSIIWTIVADWHKIMFVIFEMLEEGFGLNVEVSIFRRKNRSFHHWVRNTRRHTRSEYTHCWHSVPVYCLSSTSNLKAGTKKICFVSCSLLCNECNIIHIMVTIDHRLGKIRKCWE